MIALVVSAFCFVGYLAWIAMMLAERRSIRDEPELSRKNRENLRTFLVTIVGVVAISPAVQWATTWAYELNKEAKPAGVYLFLGLTALLTLAGIVVAAWFVRRNDSERVLTYSELRRDILDEKKASDLTAASRERFAEQLKTLDTLRDQQIAWASPWLPVISRAVSEQPDHPVDIIRRSVTTRSAWKLAWKRRRWQLLPAPLWVVGSFLGAISYHQGPRPETALVIAAGFLASLVGLLVSLFPFLVFTRQQTVTSLTKAAVEWHQQQECHKLVESKSPEEGVGGVSKLDLLSRRDHFQAGFASLKRAFRLPMGYPKQTAESNGTVGLDINDA